MTLNDVLQKNIILPYRQLLSRRRLLTVLTANQLTLILGDPGCGKTSLLIDLAWHSLNPICWLNLEPDCAQPERLIDYLLATLLKQYPQLDLFIPATLAQQAPPKAIDTLLAFCQECLISPFTIMLDNFQHLHQTPGEGLIDQFLLGMPPFISFAIASRVSPNLQAMYTLKTRWFETEDLHFHQTEIQDLLHLRFPRQTIAPSQVQRLFEVTAGWSQGILLLVDATGRLNPTPGPLHHYFEQVLATHPEAVHPFLHRTAHLPAFTPALCHQFLGPGDWATLIDTLLKHHLFIQKQGLKAETWLTYHPLFKAYLHTLPDTQAYPPPSWPKLTEAYLAVENWPAAFTVYSQQEDWAAAATLIEQVGVRLFRAGQQQQVLSWLNTLPPPTLANRPFLIGLKGILVTDLGDPRSGLTLLNEAIDKLHPDQDKYALCQSLVWRGIAYRFLGEHHLAIADANDVLALSEGQTGYDIIFAGACRVKGFSLYYNQQTDEGLTWFRKAYDVYQHAQLPQRAALVGQDMAMIYTNLGHFQVAKYYCHISRHYWRSCNDHHNLAYAENQWGVWAHYRGEYDLALTHLEEAVRLGRHSGNKRVEAAAMAGIGDIYTDLQFYQAAQTAYQKAYALAIQMADTFLINYAMVGELMLACQQGEVTTLRATFKGVQLVRPYTPYEAGLYHLALGYKAWVQTNWVEAVTQLEQATQYLTAENHIGDMARARVLLAGAQQAQGYPYHLPAETEEQTAVALAYTQPHLVQNLAKTWLSKAVETFGQQFPRQCRAVRQRASLIPLHQTRLILRAFGPPTVFFNGAEINWSSKRAPEMLFYIISQADSLTAQEIGLYFEPDSDKGRIIVLSKKVLTDIRKPVGSHILQLKNNRYYFNRELDYSYDLETYWQLIATAEGCRVNSPGQLSAYEAAVALYAEPFRGFEATWVWALRVHLQQTTIRILVTLIEAYAARAEYRRALHFCERLLEIDPCAEEGYRLGMRLSQQLGERKGIITYFERCQTALADGIDALPSPKTVTLFKALNNP